MGNNLLFLSTRKGFNTALNHFKVVTSLLAEFQRKKNLADLLNNLLNSRRVGINQIVPVLNIVLVDKFNYYYKSMNFTASKTEGFEKIAEKVKNWDMLDFVLLYNHPQLGELVVNPKNEKSWEVLQGGFKENELVVIYAGNFSEGVDKEFAEKGAKALFSLINGDSISNEKLFASATTTYKPKKQEPAPAVEPLRATADSFGYKPDAPMSSEAPAQPQAKAAVSSSASDVKKKLSPEYGITVTNELFHNGNVEAWKKIIESYETKYPDIKVVVFYDKEEIKDLNTLFKWGKVKHGTMIYIRLLAAEFKDISKLRRYLFEGASNKFENFLRGAPGQKIQLF
jgi:hypothetical protein